MSRPFAIEYLHAQYRLRHVWKVTQHTELPPLAPLHIRHLPPMRSRRDEQMPRRHGQDVEECEDLRRREHEKAGRLYFLRIVRARYVGL